MKPVTLITGATSGIGEACAKVFAQAGHELILIGRRKDRLEQLKPKLQSLGAEALHLFDLDVRSRESLQSFAVNQASLLERVQVGIINAGLARGLDPLHEGQAQNWEDMIDTNLKGALWTTELLLPPMIRKNSGHLVFLGSVAARWLYPKGNVYSATKAALHALAESIRLDLLGSAIRVTTLAPGLVETEFSEVRFSGDQKRAESVYQGIQALQPEDIADAAWWACTRPPHVTIQEMVIYPTAQASPSQIARKTT